MSSFVLKIIAMVTMLIDHLGDSIFNYANFMNIIGRIAFPIFAFQISEGYIHTKNLKKYFLRLFVFALISQAPFMLFLSMFSSEFTLNIFFTLFLGLLSIHCYNLVCSSNFTLFKNNKLDNIIKKSFGIFTAIFIGILAEVTHCDYGFFGIAIIFIFYALKNHKVWCTLVYIICCILKYAKQLIFSYHIYYLLFCLFTILPIIFINLYNKKQGRKIKYLLYIFYPAHLLILYILFGVLF